MKNQLIIRNIVLDSLFLALIVLFTFVPYLGIITIGPLSFTTIHIIVLIGACLFGYKKGVLYGLFFGIMTFLKAFMYPGTLDYFCINPLISILPRVIFGLVSGILFDILRSKLNNRNFNICIPFVAGVLTIIHTILFLMCFYIFGVKDILKISEIMGLSGINVSGFGYDSFMAFVTVFISWGAICEVVLSIILIPLVNNNFYKKALSFNRKRIVYDDENCVRYSISKSEYFYLALAMLLIIVLTILVFCF